MGGQTRVFISYSSQDSKLATRLKFDLASAGVDIWLDHERLSPDTLDWQDAVRRGVAQATHVVYVASPTAARSQYVIHEITMGREEGKTVLAFWMRGEKWYDCTPLGWILAQYIDGRDAMYRTGLAQLRTALNAPVTLPFSGNRTKHHTYPLPDVPTRLVDLGFRGVNPNGTFAIIPPMVPVAAGSFLMGSDKWRDPEAGDAETPQHTVDLPAFQIGKYPVTVAEYALAVQSGAVIEPRRSGNVSWEKQLQHLDHPVVCVSWEEAQAYVWWLRASTGQLGWRLPTEAEWEKAAGWDAKRNVSRRYPFGNFFHKSCCNTHESGIGTTTPVGSYPASDQGRSGASPWGAEEMAGNVWEWTSSVFKPYPYTATDGREAADATADRTMRGGSWSELSWYARATFRSVYRWMLLYDNGFRLALSPVAGS